MHVSLNIKPDLMGFEGKWASLQLSKKVSNIKRNSFDLEIQFRV